MLHRRVGCQVPTLTNVVECFGLLYKYMPRRTKKGIKRLVSVVCSVYGLLVLRVRYGIVVT